MSKQLAISSSFCTFALAAMALFAPVDHANVRGGDMLLTVQAESVAPGLTIPSLFSN